MGYLQSVTVLRVDRKRLYSYKRGALGGGGGRPDSLKLLKIAMSVDDDIEC